MSDPINTLDEIQPPFEVPPGLEQLRIFGNGCAGPLSTITLSPDGLTLATAIDNMIRLWELETGKLQLKLKGHTGAINSLVWAPLGHILASGSEDNTVRIWDTKNGKSMIFLGHTKPVNSVTWSPDGHFLASGSDDKTIRIWNMETKGLDEIFCGHNNSVKSVAWSPDGKFLASGSGDNSIRLWNMDKKQLHKTLFGHNNSINSIAWSPDGNILASGSEDCSILLWKMKSDRFYKRFYEHADGVTTVAWSPDGFTLASGSDDRTVRLWNIKTGKSNKTLKKHTRSVNKIAWLLNGHTLISSSSDNIIRLWDIQTGKLQSQLKVHMGYIYSMAWSPDGNIIAFGYDNAIIQLWNVQTGKLQTTLRGHSGPIRNVTWFPDGQFLASFSDDSTIRFWDTEAGRSNETLRVHAHKDLRTNLVLSPDGRFFAIYSDDNAVLIWNIKTRKLLGQVNNRIGVMSLVWSPDSRHLAFSEKKIIWLWEMTATGIIPLQGHTDTVCSLAWSPDSLTLASGSNDKTIRIWDLYTKKTANILEGHTDSIYSISYSHDSRLLCSSSKNEECIWNCKTLSLITKIANNKINYFTNCSLFNPKKPILALLNETNVGFYILDLNLEQLINDQSGSSSVRYTTAKLVLVGDSGVGKTGLGWRLTHGEFKEHSSTHGQQFWMLDDLHMKRNDGTELEAILWDLAGQPDYRLIHALFLDDAEIALVLFDPTERQEPLHGVDYWLKALEHQKEPVCKPILIGARIDRGEATLSETEINKFCLDRKIAGGYIATSALNGTGLDEVKKKIKQLIVLDSLTAITTTNTFKWIKDYVISLKETDSDNKILATPSELSTRLKVLDAQWQFSENEMMIAVGHLAKHGYIRNLRTAAGSTTVLLKPELLNNLAASFVLEARRNPKGLGALEEDLVLCREYRFPELKQISMEEQTILLDATIVLFIENNICFRETLGNTKYLIFPALINLKKPRLENEIKIEDDVSYTVKGAVENIYAALVVLLGYTSVFRRTDQWQNQAEYEINEGEICGFRQTDEQEGMTSLTLYYGNNVILATRLLFQSLVERFLINHNVTVVKYPSLKCPKCSYTQERTTVIRLINDGEGSLFCFKCGKKVILPKIEEVKVIPKNTLQIVNREQTRAISRTKFEEALVWVQNYYRDTNKKVSAPKCFISYAWGAAEHEKWVQTQLAFDLQKAGLEVFLDRWQNARTGSNVSRYIELIETSDYIIVVGTSLYRRKYENKNPKNGFVVAAEMDLINNQLIGTEAQKEKILPILVEGTKKKSFPPLLHGRVFSDFRNEADYFATLFDLILSIYRIPFNSQAVSDLRETLRTGEISR